MKRKQEEKTSMTRMERFAQAVDMPKDVISNCSKLTTYNDNQIIVENYKGIMEYSNDTIRIKTGGKMLCIKGSGLHICAITDTDILIEGIFKNVGWE
ncbi:MAG: YabP/YqfC family sporulation protein [Clostridia bacterium]|nr:YabP/YqfC family sporulation protein [Clostridia bacterium]